MDQIVGAVDEQPVHRPLGRPTKRTAARRMALLDAFGKGASKRAAAAAAVVSETFLNEWIAEDPGLADEIEVARGRHELEMLELVKYAARDPKHWTAAAWTLERLHQERYALKGPKGSSGDGDGTKIPAQIAVLIQQVLVQQPDPPQQLLGSGDQVIIVDQAAVGGAIDAEFSALPQAPDVDPVERLAPEELPET